MAADASIFSQYLKPVRSVSDYMEDMDKREANQLALAAQRQQGEVTGLQMQQARADIAEKAAARNALQQAMAGWTAATTPAERAASLRNSNSPELWKQADAIEADQRGAQKDQAEIDHKKGQTAKAVGETADATIKRFRGALDYIDTPDGAARWVVAQFNDPVLGQYMANMSTPEEAVKRIPTDPVRFQDWRKRAAMGMEKYEDQLLRDKIARENNETQVKTTGMNNATSRANNAASIAQQERSSIRADSRSGQANAIKAAEVAAGGKPPAGYRWTAEGVLEAIPGGPGDKLPEKQQNQVVGTQNLSNAINEYRAELKGYGKLSNLSPDARAAMGTKYNNMMLQAKEAYNLGVLNGPDLEILTSVITDPRSLKGAVTSNKALDAQASELDRIMKGIAKVSSNRRPQDGSTPGNPPKTPGGADPVAEALKKYGG